MSGEHRWTGDGGDERGLVWRSEAVVNGVREYVRVIDSEGEDELELELRKPGERVRILVLYRCVGEVRGRYEVRQVAPGTECEILVSGVVAEAARKEMEMRIEFVPGCVGSVGREQEEVILMGEPAANVSRPVMLCGEERVMGTHGVAVGRADEEQVRYLQSRGVSSVKGRELLMRAKLLKVAERVEDEGARKWVQKWLDGVQL